MRRLLGKTGGPPNGWMYIHKGYELKAGTEKALQVKVRQHMQVNGDPIPRNLSEVIQDQICSRIPADLCSGKDPKNFNISPSDLYKGTRAIIDIAIRGKRAFIPQEEAEKRAKECAACEFNQSYKTKCMRCRIVYGLVSGFVRQKRTESDGELGVCVLCRCLNKAQVHVAGDVLRKIRMNPEKYPTCWKRKIYEEK